MKKLFITFICISFLLACGSQKTTQPQETPSVEGEWKLESLDGKPVTNLKRPITLNFTEAEKRASGYAGCNQYFSSYTLTGSSFRFTAPGRTKMYCQETMELEERFIMALADVEVIKSEGNKLIFLKGETVLLVFSK